MGVSLEKEISSPSEDVMNVRIARPLVSFLCMCFLAVGCQKPADQPSASGTDANSSPSVADAVKKVIEPKPLVVPADTVIAVVLDQTLTPKPSTPGHKFTPTLT